MKLPKTARTVRFEPEHYARLEKLAFDQGKSMAEVVRTVIVTFLDGQPKLSASERRRLRVTDFDVLPVFSSKLSESFRPFEAHGQGAGK